MENKNNVQGLLKYDKYGFILCHLTADSAYNNT